MKTLKEQVLEKIAGGELGFSVDKLAQYLVEVEENWIIKFELMMEKIKRQSHEK